MRSILTRPNKFSMKWHGYYKNRNKVVDFVPELESLMEKENVLKAEKVLPFLLAGNALVTFKSNKTGDHFTYQINQPKVQRDEENPVYFVKVRSGHNSRWIDLGMIFKNPVPTFRLKKGCEYKSTAKSVLAFDFLIRQLNKGFEGFKTLDTLTTIYHAGLCGKCGRTLTNPESISVGLGPICAAG